MPPRARQAPASAAAPRRSARNRAAVAVAEPELEAVAAAALPIKSNEPIIFVDSSSPTPVSPQVPLPTMRKPVMTTPRRASARKCKAPSPLRQYTPPSVGSEYLPELEAKADAYERYVASQEYTQLTLTPTKGLARPVKPKKTASLTTTPKKTATATPEKPSTPKTLPLRPSTVDVPPPAAKRVLSRFELEELEASQPMASSSKCPIEAVTVCPPKPQTASIARKPPRQLSRFELAELEASQPCASGSSSPVRAPPRVQSIKVKSLQATAAPSAAKPKSDAEATGTPAPKGQSSAAPALGASDDEDDFFDMRKKIAPTLRQRLPSPVDISMYISSSGEDSDDSNPSATKKKKRGRPQVQSIKIRPEPEWARPSKRHRTSSDRGNSSIRGRTDSQSVVATPVTGEKAPEEAKRAVSLTPPPEIDPAQLEAARLRIKAHLDAAMQEENEFSMDAGLSIRNPSPTKGKTIIISLRMVADPERLKNPAMARALKDYCKLRSFKFGVRSPLSKLFSVLADRLKKPSSDLVLAYKGQKIASDLLTPLQLGINEDCSMEGYEKHVYDAIREQKRQAAEDRLALYTQQEMADDDDDDGEPEKEIVPPMPDNSFRLTIRDANGKEVGMRVTPASLCKNLVLNFCRKAGLPETAAQTLRLVVDGEKMEPDDAIGAAELEGGDVIDIR